MRSGLADCVVSIAAIGSQECGAAAVRPQDPFAADVRTTPWLSPQEERAALHAPAGFEITCFASEPEIFKPMNLAFDARGRLWCTSSTEYPYPVGPDREFKGRDRITIHEDTDLDGVADKTIVFADDLNIPIGIYPNVDREGRDGCIVFSIPNIWQLWDDDGDGRADRREVLYGPFGWERDTHGLNNSFRRGFDGWVYACHGYNNSTVVKGRDGHEVRMQSGNTYRFKPDGSRIEQFTHGQVNPFGMAFDERGDLFSADCHTANITLLLRGGCYESFGKTHDGLGFVPPVMERPRGSTALCGLAIVTGDSFPEEYAGDVLVGDVLRCRVMRDKLLWRGSTPRAVEQPDFLVSDDPWFRPVDLQIGPDGALYVADFYNRIIGHYEVPLDHPGRDRTSGRIWRIAWVGADREGPVARRATDLRAADPDRLKSLFAHPNLVVRMRALDEMTDRVDRDAATRTLNHFPAYFEAEWTPGAARNLDLETARGYVLKRWALARIGAEATYSAEERARFADARSSLDAASLMRTHELRLASALLSSARAVALRGSDLRGTDAHVNRAAAEHLGRDPETVTLEPLLTLLLNAPPSDTILRHAIRIAIRDRLATPDAFARMTSIVVGPAPTRELLAVCLALHGEHVARWILARLEESRLGIDRADELLAHAAREAAPADLPRLVALVRSVHAFDGARQVETLETILAALDRRGAAPGAEIEAWAVGLAKALLARDEAVAPAWPNAPVAGSGRSENPWCLQERECSDRETAPMLCSLPRGESRTGALRSPEFGIPPRLSFFLAGHDGETDRPPHSFNKVRVRDAQSGELLAEVRPPRHDTAQRIELDLSAAAGRRAFLEAIDGNPYDGWAWLAIGRFEPEVFALPERSPADESVETTTACRLALRFGAERFSAELAALLSSPRAEPAARAAAAAALAARMAAAPLASALAALIDDPETPRELIEPVCAAIATGDAAALLDAGSRAVEIAAARQQVAVAAALARAPAGAGRVLDLVAGGRVSPMLLAKPEVIESVRAALGEDGARRVAELTRVLPGEDLARVQRMVDLRKSFARDGGDPRRGADLFTKHCAACHQLAGRGAVIGPQLDGLQTRGFERLIEDLLDPDRNVDPRFRRTNLFLADGDVLSVLVLREEGEVLVHADELGKEHELPLARIASRRDSRLSLMPADLAAQLADDELRDLLAHLLAAR